MWRIPAKNTKAGKARSVPLNPSALHVIRQLDTKGKFEYLFVNRQTETRFVGIPMRPPAKILAWVHHLSSKTWMNPSLMAKFIQVAGKQIHWTPALP